MTREQHTKRLRAVRLQLFRLACCLFLFSFLLPYVDVMGCSTKKIVTYRGYQLIQGPPAVFYLASVAVCIAMLAFSFYRKETTLALRAFGAVWRAMGAAASGFVIGLLPGLQFLFDGVFMLAGQLLGLVCIAALFADGLVISIRDYLVLRREAPAPSGKALPPALSKLHGAAAAASLLFVPLYGYALRSEIILALLYFLVLSLPFLLSQAIALEAVKRGERWTLRWAPAVLLLLAGAAVLIIAGLV